ncbi:hypothetical protein LVJ78_01640 [Uruburuella suis]|jgi:hypothetical protein|uniref:DUF6968 domain-containing protein n=2 Tax=Uruburuella suis TaxID=252130 RepID=A0AAE9GVH4_9NEIS|nr:hypothetical protein [Uruburuella suis]UOO79761.1 hypothetical protein LVJ78_01640 [Uruburuella suis]
MMLEKLTMETAIAHRIYEVADKPGEEVQIFIGKPVQYDLNEWHCPYRIVGAGKDLNFHIAAVDSIQALQLIWPVVDSAISGADLSLLWGGGKNLGLVSE